MPSHVGHGGVPYRAPYTNPLRGPCRNPVAGRVGRSLEENMYQRAGNELRY